MAYFIASSNYIYTRLMLFSWSCESELTNISQTNTEFFTKKLKEYLRSSCGKDILVNCNNIIDIDDHVMKPIIDFIDKNKINILFYSEDNVNRFIDYLSEHYKSHISTSKAEEGLKVFAIGENAKIPSSIRKTIITVKKDEQNFIEKIVSDSYSKSDTDLHLSSTPLRTDGEFDASFIISNPSHFRWVVLLLVEQINVVIQTERPRSHTIISASLRGSAIAGAVRELMHFLSGSDFFVIDHIGPRHDVIERPTNYNFWSDEYCIYIGDFLIAGTELKITNAYCQFLGGSIHHAFVIGKYTQLTTLNNKIKLHSLVSLRNCVAELNYTLD